jgi:hypothetical protein
MILPVLSVTSGEALQDPIHFSADDRMRLMWLTSFSLRLSMMSWAVRKSFVVSGREIR